MESLKEITMEELNEKYELLNQKLDFLIENFTEPKEIYTFEEACDYLRSGKTFIKGEIEKGNIRFKKKGTGDQKLFKKIWLDAWMEI